MQLWWHDKNWVEWFKDSNCKDKLNFHQVLSELPVKQCLANPILEGQIGCAVWLVTLKGRGENSIFLQIYNLYTIQFHISSCLSLLQFARVIDSVLGTCLYSSNIVTFQTKISYFINNVFVVSLTYEISPQRQQKVYKCQWWRKQVQNLHFIIT